MFGYVDDFDLAAGLYHWAVDNYPGQWSAEYQFISSGLYRPGAMETSNHLSEDARDIYDSLDNGDLDFGEACDMLFARLEE